ncbi:MAG: thioredoxin family protein [Calditrichaceae bacterium]
MVSVKVLGAGCTKCKALEQKLNDIKIRHKLELEIEKVTQLDEIMNYGVMMTPGLVINEKLRSTGKVPDENQLLKWIEEA